MCFMLSFKGSKWELFWGLTHPPPGFRKRMNPGVTAGSASNDYCSLGENKCASGGRMTNW